MRTIRLCALFTISFVMYTWIDVLLWQRIFEHHEQWQFIPEYKKGWGMVLLAIIFTGSIALSDIKDSAWFAAAFFLSAWGGTEDVLYYVLDGRNVPEYYHWLEGNRLLFGYDKNSVVISALFWQLVNIFLLILRKHDLRLRHSQHG